MPRGYHSWSNSSSFSNPFSSHFESREHNFKRKYSGSDRFDKGEDYRRTSYKHESSRERRSPERKRFRVEEAPSYRYENYYGSSRDYPPISSERRSSRERHHSPTFSRREEYRRPLSPPKRSRISSRGPRSFRGRNAPVGPVRRRLVDSSYGIRRMIPRISEYSRRFKITNIRSTRRIKKENDEDNEVTVKEDKAENGEKNEESVKDEQAKPKSFIKLVCPQCRIEVPTFRKYEIHLRGRQHMFSMKKAALKQRTLLIQMRKAQRNTQNELEKSTDDLEANTNFCLICKLNYKQKKAVHQMSDSHKNIKKILAPFCKVCNIPFRNPMMYQNHCCSISHIKREQRMDPDSDVEEDNLENFTTVDSVGDVEGSDHEIKEEEELDHKELGLEKITLIEARYCDLCKMYLQRGNENEVPNIISRHCKQRVHRQRYMRFKAGEEMKKQNEIKEAKETEETGIGEEGEAQTDEAKDDKMWADVDKELGDFLAEVENKSTDDEDDAQVTGDRYDRFKLSEQKGEDSMENNGAVKLENKQKKEVET